MTRTEKGSPHPLAVGFTMRECMEEMHMGLIYNTRKEWLPDYDKWIRKPLWQYVTDRGVRPVSGTAQDQATPLLFNLEPTKTCEFFRDIHPSSVEGSSYKEIQSLLTLAIIGKSYDFHAYPALLPETIPGHPMDEQYIIYYVRPAALLRWAISVSIGVPEPFLILLNEEMSSGNFHDSTPEDKTDKRDKTPAQVGQEVEDLVGWKQIAGALRCSTKTAQRLKKRNQGMPVTYNKSGSPIAYSITLKAWYDTSKKIKKVLA